VDSTDHERITVRFSSDGGRITMLGLGRQEGVFTGTSSLLNVVGAI
jgi:hypothetical protein